MRPTLQGFGATQTATIDVGREAQLYVPRLLSVLGSNEAARQSFGEGWGRVPLRLLLPWVAQMLSLLDAPQGEALLPSLQVSPYASSKASELSMLLSGSLVKMLTRS